jgi:hypothetical protein
VAHEQPNAIDFSDSRLGIGFLNPLSLLGDDDWMAQFVAWDMVLHTIETKYPAVLVSLADVGTFTREEFRDVQGPARRAVHEWLQAHHVAHPIASLAAIGTLTVWSAHPRRAVSAGAIQNCPRGRFRHHALPRSCLHRRSR